MSLKAASRKEAKPPRRGFQRPLRVLLCPDQPDWAFHNIARNIIRHAPEDFDISLHFMGKPGERDLSILFETMLLKDIDIVHVFWREDLFEVLRPETLIHIAGQLRLQVEEVVAMISTRALTTSVYDHLHSSEQSMAERSAAFHLIDGYSVCSKKLRDIYTAQIMLPGPDGLTPDGVDLDLFRPIAEKHAPVDPNRLAIGWVGNSGWGRSQGGDPKGFQRLFAPAIEMLKARGLTVDLHLADPQVRRVPFAEMPDFYRRLDVLACTSAVEGTPNPVLEAMASGVAVAATDVGIVPEVFGPRQSRYILRDPDPAAFADAFEHLARHRDELSAIAQENLESIAGWSWAHVCTAVVAVLAESQVAGQRAPHGDAKTAGAHSSMHGLLRLSRNPVHRRYGARLNVQRHRRLPKIGAARVGWAKRGDRTIDLCAPELSVLATSSQPTRCGIRSGCSGEGLER